MHQNYVGSDTDKEPFVLSVVVTDANNHNVPQYRAILWRKTVRDVINTHGRTLTVAASRAQNSYSRFYVATCFEVSSHVQC